MHDLSVLVRVRFRVTQWLRLRRAVGPKHSPTTIFTAMIKYFMRVTGCCSFVERSGYVYGEPFYGEP